MNEVRTEAPPAKNAILTDPAVHARVSKAIEAISEFHCTFCNFAPGLTAGAYMVDLATEALGAREGVVLNAVPETRVCLTDALQCMLGTTLGNKRLRLDAIHYGRYAFTLFERENGRGVRVAVDLAKIDRDAFPETWAFFAKSRDYAARNRNERGRDTIAELHEQGRSIYTVEEVDVILPPKDPLKAGVQCPRCRESFTGDPGPAGECPGCQDGSYYRRPALDRGGSAPK